MTTPSIIGSPLAKVTLGVETGAHYFPDGTRKHPTTFAQHIGVSLAELLDALGVLAEHRPGWWSGLHREWAAAAAPSDCVHVART